MMRAVMMAAALAAFAAPAALAGPWSDPQKAFEVDNPKNWSIQPMPSASADAAIFVGGTADEECWFVHIKRTDTVGRTVAELKRSYANPLGAEQWVSISSGMNIFGGAATASSTAVETGPQGWPIQTAVLAGKDGPVVAALHGRPGGETRVYCLSFDGKDRAAEFRTIANSVRSPKDAEYAAAEAAEAAKAAADAEAAAAAAAAAAQDGKKDKRKRN